MTNDERAAMAAEALRTFTANGGSRYHEEEARVRIQDLVCNLCHLSERVGADPAAILQNGLTVYHEEKDEQDQLFLS